jgi:hypothetical protein
MYADFKCASNGANHIIMFKYTRELGMPLSFVDTCEKLYGVSATNYITPHGTTPHIFVIKGTIQEDLIKLGFLPVRSCLKKSMLMLLFASYLRKLALL